MDIESFMANKPPLQLNYNGGYKRGLCHLITLLSWKPHLTSWQQVSWQEP